MKKTYYRGIILTGICLAFSAGTAVQAQKLKNVQEGSVVAPAGIRIDGRDTEWNNAFQAENKTTSLFYTISNDDKNLYLVVKSVDVANNAKILAGGITLAINTEGKKKENDAITLTYPLINRNNPGGGERRRVGGFFGGGQGGGGQRSAEQRDSMMTAMQKTQLAQVKEIKIKNFKNTTDTLVSIYNDLGIKAVARINDDKSLFYELAIPLESLGLSKTSPKEFAYNVKLNGLQLPGLDGGGFGGGRGNGGGGFGGGRGPGGGGRGPGGIDFQALTSPTDFWGKYMLK